MGPLVLLLALSGLVFAVNRKVVRDRVIDIISFCINRYLLWKYPVSRLGSDLPKDLPTVPYRFPNGQGDVAKFLQGESNSQDWRVKHGSVYRIWSGMTPEIVLTTADDVKAVFKDSDLHSKGVNNDAGWLMGQLLGSCLGLISGAEWQSVRAHTGMSFTQKNTVANVSRIETLTKRHLALLHDQGRLESHGLDPVKDLRLLPFWVIADNLYGPLTEAMRSELQHLIPLREELFARVIQGGVTRFSWSRYLPTRVNMRLKAFREKWVAFNDRAHGVCKLAGVSAPVVHMYAASENGLMTRENLYQTLDEMLFANLDVTIGSISWNILFLAAHPEVQSEIRAEVSRAKGTGTGGGGGGGGGGGDPAAWHGYLCSSSTLLAASILESARLKPLAAFTVPQAAPTERVVGSGYRIPAGTSFVVDTNALNSQDPRWGKTGQAYDPTRYASLKASELRYRYWRFGFGPRQCLGRYAADLIMRILIASLVETYTLGMASNSSWDREPGTWTMQPDTVVRCQRRASS
ncbi:cytochrome P450 [Polyplosphaeria fusca]|uniref:Cytochrome P450 n=1 Tax=Polyplosphaeria fusca TaxID=682080 RepID=A0A9P4UXN6_9PLEO|nr:cytochrome P450 [Polyplosphaeria fusca]